MEIELRNAIQDDKLILFIGSGLSKQFGFPDWKGLLISILKKLDGEYLNFIPLLNSNLMTISDVLAKLEINHKTIVTEQLENTFSNFAEDVNFLLHKKLLKLSSKVITTNYDKAFENADNELYVANIFDDFTLNKLSSKERYLFKLHGCVSSPANCILFPSQYDEMYSNDEKSSIFKLKNLVQQNTILFIGYSMSDIEIVNILKNIKFMFGGYSPKHFIISTDDFSNNDVVSNHPHPKLNDYGQLESVIDGLIDFKAQKKSDEIITSKEFKKTKVESVINTELTVEEELKNFEYLQQNMLDFRKKFSKQYTANFFNKIISKDCSVHFTEQEYNDLLTFFKSDSFSWDKKVILLGSLTISGMKNNVLDIKRIELLISIIEYHQDEIWQRALLSLVLNLLRWDKKIEGNKILVHRLENLKNQSHIQEAYFFIADMLKNHENSGWKDCFENYNKDRQDDLSPENARFNAMTFVEENTQLALALIFTEFKEYSKDFFTSENWFLPYTSNNDFVKHAKANCIHNVNIYLLEELIKKSIALSSSQKYSLLGNINNLTIEQVNRLFEIYSNEQEGYRKIDIKEFQFINIEDFWREILQFYYSFPNEKMKDIQLQELQLSQNVITKLILKDEKVKKMQGIYYSNLADEYENKHDYINAEKYYLKSLSIDSENLICNGNYANFLRNIKKDYENAEKSYLKSLRIEPNNGDSNCNYALFLYEIKKDYQNAENFYQVSLSIDSENIVYIGNYANFLKDVKKDYENAEKYYLKSLSIDSENALNNCNYAFFLFEIKKDYIYAEEYFLRSLSIDSENSFINMNYAVFLKEVKNDYQNAEKFYLKSLSIDSLNTYANINYADFLLQVMKDNEGAEKHFLKSLSIDSENATFNTIYANFLNYYKNDFLTAEKYYLKSLSIDSDDISCIGNYANLLQHVNNDFLTAEKYYLKALSLNSEDVNSNANYAQLLLVIERRDEANKFLEKAFFINNGEKNSSLIELWFYKYAHYLESIDESEKVIEDLLNENIDSNGWSLRKNLEVAIKNGHPNPEKLKEFAIRITKIEI